MGIWEMYFEYVRFCESAGRMAMSFDRWRRVYGMKSNRE